MKGPVPVGAGLAAMAVAVAAFTGLQHPQPPLPGGPGAPVAVGTPPAGPAPGPGVARQDDRIVFRVQGSGHPAIGYGTDSSDHQVPGRHGPYHDGVTLPWTASVAYSPAAFEYYVSAQGEGPGSVTATITEVVTTWCRSGVVSTRTFPLEIATATGFAAATAQDDANYGGTGNAKQAADAGC